MESDNGFLQELDIHLCTRLPKQSWGPVYFPGSDRHSLLCAPPHFSSVMFGARLLLLIVVVVLLCGVVLFCLQCWLKRCGIDRPRRTMAVFAVGDLDPVYGELLISFWVPLWNHEKLSLQGRFTHLENTQLLGEPRVCIKDRSSPKREETAERTYALQTHHREWSKNLHRLFSQQTNGNVRR